MSEDADPRLYVGALARGLAVLTALAQAGRPVTVSEAASLANLDRSAAQRMLHTLRVLGFLRQEEGSRRYVLAARVLDLAHGFLQADALRRVALPFLDDLARRSEETVNLTELDGADVVYVARIPSRHVVSVDLAIGTRLPAWCTAPGRAILSCLPAGAADGLIPPDPLARPTPRTAKDRAAVLARVAKARRDGHAVNDQETFVGDISVAAAVVNRAGAPIGAVNIAVPFPRWTRDRAARDLAPLVVATSAAISREFGGAR